MPSTSVHFPNQLLEDLDRLAAEVGQSRNRLIVEACREILQKRLDWPKDFFDPGRFSAEEMETLRASQQDFDATMLVERRSRQGPPF